MTTPETTPETPRPRSPRKKKTTSPSDTPAPETTDALVITAEDMSRLMHYPDDVRNAGIHLALCAVDSGISVLRDLRRKPRIALELDYKLHLPLPCNTPLWSWQGDDLHFHCIRRINKL